jgi:uncharacterized protein YceK
MKIKENTILVLVFLMAMYLIVISGCTVVTSDDPSWRWPKSNAEVSSCMECNISGAKK